jgi:hydroxymethylpyrimidine/phosphomethylpyrimidine kinase
VTDRVRRVDVSGADALRPSETPPVALTIAGSDSGGGAGIAADLRTFAAHGVFGTMAITAVTAQSTMKVSGIVAIAPSFVDQQIDAVLGDLDVKAAKTGMLANVATIDLLARRAADGRLPKLVVDPVMIATSGAALVEGDAALAYRRLIAHASIVTPNLPEAEALVGRSIASLGEMAEAARELVELGARVAVVKGGHREGGEAIDVVYDGTEIVELVGQRIETHNVHGTGCTLAAAMAAQIALGADLLHAVIEAKRYVARVISASRLLELGEGPGPLDHFAPLR